MVSATTQDVPGAGEPAVGPGRPIRRGGPHRNPTSSGTAPPPDRRPPPARRCQRVGCRALTRPCRIARPVHSSRSVVMRANCAPAGADRAAPPAGAPRRDRGAARLALLSFAMMIVSLDQYIVVVALPEI